jgi:hypothetical protein
MEVAPILEVSRAEEGSSQSSIRERPLRDRLRDCALPCSCQPIQPINRRLGGVPCPQLDIVQNGFTSSLQTTFAIAVLIFCPLCSTKTFEGVRFACPSSCQSHITRNTKMKWCDQGPVERLVHCWDVQVEYSRSDCILPRRPPFAVPPVVLVNIEGDSRVMITNEPGNRR